MDAALTLEGVACARGGQHLFAGVSVAVPAGRLLRVRGANGAGKTTLLRAVCGLGAPAAGRIAWRGEPVTSIRDAGGLVHLGHAPALKGELSALENLLASRGVAGWPCDRTLALEALAQAGLRGREHLPARLLSQGQRRRAALAALAVDAPIGLWVLDEPFEALDTVAVDWLRRVVAARLARGAVVVLTTHLDMPADPSSLTVDLDRHRVLAVDEAIA